jgi:hypothetical protein
MSSEPYQFKALPELGWAVLIGLVVVLGEALLTFDESVFSDPRAWGVALITGAARSVGASVLNTLRKGSA